MPIPLTGPIAPLGGVGEGRESTDDILAFSFSRSSHQL